MSKDPSREIAMKLVYYLVVAKSSRRDSKYFKPKIVFYYLHERVSIRVLRTWWVKVPKKLKIRKIERKKERNPRKRDMN